MSNLTPVERNDRLMFDYRLVRKMYSPIMSVEAYRSVDDLFERRNPIASEQEGHLALHYVADYKIKTLLGPDKYSSNTSVHFDLLAGGDYPMTDPACWVISKDIPWTPHFAKGRPICIGDIWTNSRGRMLLGHLLVHVAKLLNFDEIPRSDHYGGYTPSAFYYWRDKFNLQPITVNLPYPVLPSEATSRVAKTEPVFRPVAKKQSPLTEFRRKQTLQPTALEFRRKQASAVFVPSRKNPNG